MLCLLPVSGFTGGVVSASTTVSEFDFLTQIEVPNARPSLDVSNDGDAVYVVGFHYPYGYDSRLARSDDLGQTWQLKPIPNDIRNSFPSVTVISDEVLYLASGGDTVGASIYKSSTGGNDWTLVGSPSNGGRALDPKLWINASENPAALPDDDIHIAYWSDVTNYYVDRKVYYDVSHDGGTSWDGAVKVCTSEAAYQRILIGDGRIFIFFVNVTFPFPPYPAEYVVSSDWGETWSGPNYLTTSELLMPDWQCTMVSRVTYYDEQKALMSVSVGTDTESQGIVGYFWYSNETFQVLTRYDIYGTSGPGSNAQVTFNAVVSQFNGKLHCCWGNVASPTPIYYAHDSFGTGGDESAPTAVIGASQMQVFWRVWRFDARGSTDNVGVVRYQWDFGDGRTSSAPVTYNLFARVGTYVVTLTVWDEAGNSDIEQKTILVKHPFPHA